MEKILQQILNRLDSMETKMDSMEVKMDSMETKMDSMETKMGSMEVKMDSMENKMDSMETKMNSVETRLTVVEDNQKEFSMELSEVRKETAFYYGSLMKKLDETKAELSSEITQVVNVQKQHQSVLEYLNEKQ
ncbi:hypothetical protein [Bacillus sp. B1-b2]|uniref:hypothetical protein n=1 Tax=Bacillus sp. B1-b2 TaxID=2653201 RepID=UPI001262987C|nr:hypothetical protein [Bacillus sp. B1-b2]KAB7665873.1 hypothetical protein F9279_18935 [Bacillus sp. B1-b2]